MNLDSKAFRSVIAEELSGVIVERLATVLKLAKDLAKLGADDASMAAENLAGKIGKTRKAQLLPSGLQD